MPVLSHGCSARNKKYADLTPEERTYRLWLAMKTRCNNPRSVGHKNYGERQITVCSRWSESFSAFLSDMGPCPEGLSLEREDNDLGYSPSNCIWADMKTQSRNRRSVVQVSYRGQVMTLKEAAAAAGVPYSTVKSRRKAGFPASEWFVPRISSTKTKEAAK